MTAPHLSDGMNIAVSGMQGQQWQFAAAANNVANDDTPGYSTERVNLQSLANGGVTESAQFIPPSTPNGNDVDLGSELAGMSMNKGLYTADAKVISTQREMDQALLDIVV
jgi:flagellar hook protein FlgE